jgi:hypothetical protein
MGLGSFFRTLLKVGATVPGPWQVPAAVGSAGLGAMDEAGATRKSMPYYPGGDPRRVLMGPQYADPRDLPGWDSQAGVRGGGIPGAPQGPAGAYGYAGVPSLAQLDSEWRGMRSGSGAFGTPMGVMGPPIPMGKDLGRRGGFGTGANILSLLGPLGLKLLLRRFAKGKTLPSDFRWPGGAANNPNLPEYADTDTGDIGDLPSEPGDIYAAEGLPPTLLPQGATIYAHPGEVAQVIPADQVAAGAPDPLTLPPGPPGPPGTPAPVQPSDLQFEQNLQGVPTEGAPQPPPIMAEGHKGIGATLLQYLPLILGGGGALALAARHSKANPPPPGQSSALSNAFQGLVEGYAGGKLKQALDARRQSNEQNELFVKQAHDTVMKFRGVDLTSAPPGLKQRFSELNQKYAKALSKDSPGGTLLTTSEAAEIISLGTMLDTEMAKVKEASGVRERELQNLAPYLAGQAPNAAPNEASPEQMSAARAAYAKNFAEQQGALAGRYGSVVTPEQLGQLGLPPGLAGMRLTPQAVAALLREQSAGTTYRQVGDPTSGFPEWHAFKAGRDLGAVRDMLGQSASGVAKLPNQTQTTIDNETGRTVTNTVPGGFARPPIVKAGGAPTPKPRGIAPPPVPVNAGGPTETPSKEVVAGKVGELNSPKAWESQTLETIKTVRALIPEVRKMVKDTGGADSGLVAQLTQGLKRKGEGALYSALGTTPDTPSGRLISKMSVISLLASSPYAGRSRAYQYLQQSMKHTPQVGDSNFTIQEKLNNLEDILPKIEQAIQSGRGLKGSTPEIAPPPGTPPAKKRIKFDAQGNETP